MSDNPRHKNAGQPPVSAHPAFPVIVALWFAALLGIGSMVLPIDMFERFAVASGLSEVYQAAQPPLGASARIGVALGAGVIGALAGLAIARRIAAANTPPPVTRRAAALRPSTGSANAFAKRPISAHEELGEGGLDADDEPVAPREANLGRRRALAITEESARSEFLAFAPLPGQSPNNYDEPLDLLAFEEPEVPAPEEVAAIEEPAPALEQNTVFGSAALSGPPSSTSLGDFAMPDATAAQAAPFERKVEPVFAEPPVTPAVTPAVPVGERALGELGVVELVERFALALQRHREAADAVSDDTPGELPTVSVPEFEIAARQGFEAPAGFVPVAVDAAAQFSAIPAALRPFGFDEELADEGEDADALPDYDLTAALSHSRGAIAARTLETADEPEFVTDDESEDVAEAEYTSLLAMKSPFGHTRERVRIEDFEDDEGDEPVVVFPGQAVRRAAPASDGPARDAVTALATPAAPRPFDAPLARAHQAATTAHVSFGSPALKPANPGETERALRDALEKLQKMSGAA